jgi:hypothetical protein
MSRADAERGRDGAVRFAGLAELHNPRVALLDLRRRGGPPECDELDPSEGKPEGERQVGLRLSCGRAALDFEVSRANLGPGHALRIAAIWDCAQRSECW